MELYLQRRETAIGYTAEKYGARLNALSLGLVQNEATAEECVNDTYLQAWQSIPPNEPRTYLYPYLARITRHISLNCCRYRRQLKRSAQIQTLSRELEQCLRAPEDTATQVDAHLLAQSISAFLRALPEQKRLVFLRRYWFLDTIEDIAARFGLHSGQVKTMLFRCRKALRAYLEKEGYTL